LVIVVEGEGEFSVVELQERLHLIETSTSGWLETLVVARKVRFPLEEELIVPLSSSR
jgi:hypothetical protein